MWQGSARFGCDLALVTEAARLQVEPREGAERHGIHVCAQPQAVPHLPGHRGRDGLGLFADDLDADLQLVQLMFPIHDHSELADLPEPTEDVLERAWNDVHPAHRNHVVDPPDYAALEAPKRPAAVARGLDQLHPIACPIADDGAPQPPQVGDHQFPLAGQLPGRGIDDLNDELAFVHVEARLRLALEPPAADLGRAGVIVTASPPSLLDTLLRGGDAPAGPARMDGDAHVRVPDVDALILGHLGEMQGIGGG